MFGFFLAAAVGILTSNKGKSTPVTPAAGNSGQNSGSSSGNSVAAAPAEAPAVVTYITTPDRVVSHSGCAYRNVTRSRETYTGFEDISICRPRFIFFKVSGLRPNTRHFAFFDKKNVTGYINTDSFTYAQRETLSRNSPLRNPGERYVGSTGFPLDDPSMLALDAFRDGCTKVQKGPEDQRANKSYVSLHEAARAAGGPMKLGTVGT